MTPMRSTAAPLLAVLILAQHLRRPITGSGLAPGPAAVLRVEAQSGCGTAAGDTAHRRRRPRGGRIDGLGLFDGARLRGEARLDAELRARGDLPPRDARPHLRAGPDPHPPAAGRGE